MQGPEAENERATLGGFLAALVAVFSLGASFWLLSHLTAEFGEFMGSPFYGWGWLILPAVSFAAGWVRPHPAAFVYGVGAVLPEALAAVVPVLMSEPEDGLFLVVWMFTAVRMALAAIAAVGGSVLGRHYGEASE